MAVKWATPLDAQAANKALSAYSLTLATDAPSVKERATGAARDPRPVNINQSETLAWVSGAKVSNNLLSRINADTNVEWVAPVYQAVNADPGPQSYFTINPTVLLLTQEAAAVVRDITSLDESASIDERRSRLLKGFVVLNLPKGNALEVASRINDAASAQGVTNGVKFENIPYISPICHGGPNSGTHTASASHGQCAASTEALIPNDTFYPTQWGLERINAPHAWPLSEGDPNVVVAVLDQGVELGHPDLNLWPVSYSSITHTNNGGPVGNHGTACAGIISAKIGNAQGVAGLAGKCRVMAIATNFADTEVAEGLYFAADNGARVVSMSFGVYPSWMIWDFTIIEAALQYCQEKNVVLVAASGNENQNVSRFPGTDPRTICIGGSNRADVRKAVGDTSVEPFWGACFGPDVDVVAPCLEIPTTDRLGAAGYTPTDYDMRFNGTSSATPHVAALAGLLISVNPALSNADVRQIISETTDKINTPAYTYLPTPGKPYGTWNNDVGYGRINAERALLVACSSGSACADGGPCCVELPTPDECCVSPCDPPWLPDDQCLVWYETRFFQPPIRQRSERPPVSLREYIEFRITYEHRFCLRGKQHGPLIYTVTLLPGEKVTLYHSDRYRRITSVQDRYSVQTTFMQFLSAVHQARVTGTLDALTDTLASVKGSASVSAGGNLAGMLGLPSGSASSSASVTSHNMLRIGVVADLFTQSVLQSSLLTHAERSVVVSTYEEKDIQNVTSRVIHNENACRAVTYFVRKVVELYAISTVVTDISYRVIARNILPDWRSTDDIGETPEPFQTDAINALRPLPRVGDVSDKPKLISIPTDGTVYDPELAHCNSCEPERDAALMIQLEKQKAEAMKACLEAQVLEVELERRRLLLQKGELAPFEAAPPAP
jgi:thermitase